MAAKPAKRLTIKQLESHLQQLDDFERPKVKLEQYATPAHIAATLINYIDTNHDDLRDKLVADLGCGTGRLTAGCILCDAKLVFGFDIDKEALDIGLKNLDELLEDGRGQFDMIQASITSSDSFWQPMGQLFETVVMNPPFGTKTSPGLDMLFLKRAIDISSHVVYSLHKTSTRAYIQKQCTKWAVKGKPVGQIQYNLDKTYKFHKKDSVDIEVDLWRITR